MSISIRNITIGKKLLVGFMSIALLVAVTGYIGVRETRQIQRSFEEAASSSVPAIQALEEIKRAENEIALRIGEFPAGTETADEKSALIGKVETLVRWSERYDRAVIAGEADARLVFSQNVKTAEEDVILNAFKLLGLKERGISGDVLDASVEDLEKAQARLKRIIDEAIRDELAHIEENDAHVSTASDETVRNIFLASALTFAFAASMGLVFARSIGAPVRRLKKSVERFGIRYAGGSTEVPVGTGDEIRQLSQSFNWMKERLEETTVHRDRLERQLIEREVMLSEIHHRVKNNLEIVSSLLDLQAADLVDQRALPLFRRSQDRIRSMALIHEQLYQSEDLAKLDFGEYLRNLVANLQNAYGTGPDSVDVKFDVEHIFMGIDSAIPCGLIINELVSNALEHAFPAGRHGEISISLRLDKDSRYQLAVCDNGVRLPDGLDFRNTKSLGLKLVNALTAQLKGNIEVDQSSGTAFRITFEANKPEVTT